jgi:signal transduction histidine kinase
MCRSFKPCPLILVLSLFLARVAGSEARAAEVANTTSATPQTNQLPTLTSAEQIHRLSRQEAATSRHVLIRGVITCTLLPFGAAVVQDGRAGIYINNVNASSGDLPQVGDLVEVEGTTDQGDFAPRVQASRIKRLGAGEMPAPVHPYWDQLINGSLDTEFVELEGIVTSVLTNGVVLRTHDGKINVRVYDTNEGTNGVSLKNSENALVRMRGCLFASWNGVTHEVKVNEIWMYNPSVSITEPAPADLFADALKSVPDLLMFDPRASALRRVKVSGQVMHQRQGEYFAMDGVMGFRFIPGKPVDFAAGDLVEVVGFPSLTGPSPVLEEAIARKVGVAPLRDPRPLNPEELFKAENDAVRVKVEAVVLNASQDRRTLELQAGLHRFVARFDEPKLESGSASVNFPIGSRLQLTGVYAGNGGNRPASDDVASFELLLNSAADVQMLALPPFWTLRRTLVLVGVLLGVLALSLVWIRLLRHEVQQRTVQLQNEVHNREQAERQHALAQERARIARDLHDDLGSSLTEISMLATISPNRRLPVEQAAERMESIAGKSRTLVKALDEIVWVVDPARDTLASMVRYLASYAEEYLTAMDVACRVQIPNSFADQSVSGRVRHHLLLAVKEALNNAVRHGRGTEVTFRVRVEDDRLCILIADNGSGFDLSAPSRGHGLSNLRERLEQLHGRCELESSPGKGTRVSLQVPFSAFSNSA